MTTRTAFNRFVSCGVGIILALLFVSSVVKAQCPTDIHPTVGETGYQAWAGPFTRNITITGTSCTVDIIYCVRTVNGVLQRYIEEINPTSSGCDNLTWTFIMNDVREYFFRTLSSELCGSPHIVTVATVFTASCAEMIQNGPCKFCAGAYCAKTCDVCWDVITKQNTESNCRYTQIGTANCSAAPDGWPNLSVRATNSWPSGYFNVCYLSQSCGE